MSDENVVGRDEFQRMLRDAENGRFDCLLVWEIDRFGRERQDIPTGKMTLKRAGVKPHIDLLQYQRKRTALACSSAVQMQRTVKIDIFVFGAEGTAAYKTGPVCSMPASCAGAIFNSGRSFR